MRERALPISPHPILAVVGYRNESKQRPACCCMTVGSLHISNTTCCIRLTTSIQSISSAFVPPKFKPLLSTRKASLAKSGISFDPLPAQHAHLTPPSPSPPGAQLYRTRHRSEACHLEDHLLSHRTYSCHLLYRQLGNRCLQPWILHDAVPPHTSHPLGAWNKGLSGRSLTYA